MVIHAFPLLLLLAFASGYHVAYWMKRFPAIWQRRGFWLIGMFILGTHAVYFVLLVLDSQSERLSWALIVGFVLRFLRPDETDR